MPMSPIAMKAPLAALVILGVLAPLREVVSAQSNHSEFVGVVAVPTAGHDAAPTAGNDAMPTAGNDKVLVVRLSAGKVWLLELGTGCSGLWRNNGNDAMVVSPDFFAGVGSTFHLDGQECRILGSTQFDLASSTTAPTPAPATPSPSSTNIGPPELARDQADRSPLTVASARLDASLEQ